MKVGVLFGFSDLKLCLKKEEQYYSKGFGWDIFIIQSMILLFLN